MPDKKGIFIVIDGTDGSGKTTQLELLKNRLVFEGKEIKMIDFPQYNTKSAGLVEEYLSGKYGSPEEVGPYRASIFYACDRYDASFKIKKWLNEGKIVIANRYVPANMGHQGCKIADEEERKKYFQWNYDLEYKTFEIPQPDLSIILHVNPEISQKLSIERKREDWNGKVRDIHEEDLHHLKKAEKVYLEIAKSFPGFILIECSPAGEILPKEKIHYLIWEEIKKFLNL